VAVTTVAGKGDEAEKDRFRSDLTVAIARLKAADPAPWAAYRRAFTPWAGSRSAGYA
jgi:hypothetical protein